jgi:diguanylate cyclase (GGDEF)-like protein
MLYTIESEYLFSKWPDLKDSMMSEASINLLYFASACGVFVVFLILFIYYVHKYWKKKYLELNAANLTLRAKIEDTNVVAEKRVKRRTTELENSLKMVTYQATHDLLTDLPNQRSMLDYLYRAIENAKKTDTRFAVFSFSLNEIEKINDGLGYQVSDYVIQIIAQRFQRSFSPTDKNIIPVARYTITISRKDIFIMLLDPLVSNEEVENGDIFFSILEEPVDAMGQSVKLTASIGVSVYPRDGKDAATLLMNADSAMLYAKRLGGNNLSVYKLENTSSIPVELEKERNLHNAVRNNEFLLQYQPFISLKTGKICGAEALVRWNSPVLGFVNPDDFISLAEANGIIIPLGEWVLRNTCLQVKVWSQAGFHLKIAVNLSAKQLLRKNIVELISEILKTTGLDPQYLELELTETEAFNDEVIPIVKELKQLGLSLSIDDFGTGYSNLSKLKLFAFDALKIDKSFISDVATNADSRAIVANTIELANKINVQVIAEGVETKAQLDFLKSLNCDMVQGYYFSPPVYPDAFTDLLKGSRIFTI